MVDAEFNIEARELITAPKIAAKHTMCPSLSVHCRAEAAGAGEFRMRLGNPARQGLCAPGLVQDLCAQLGATHVRIGTGVFGERPKL